MAIYHLSAQVIGRSSGRSSVAAAAYRLGVVMDDERTGLRHDYTRKSGVSGWEQMTPANAPEWMKNPTRCWNSVEQVEKRKDAQLCREINMALPVELTNDQKKDLTRAWVKANCVDQGMVATVAWHHLDGENPHAHVMVSMREIGPEGWGKKIRQEWGKERKDELSQWRESWAEQTNKALELAGSQERIDHRSLKDQGLDRQAERHMGPKATAMERRGATPDRQRLVMPTPAAMGHDQAKADREREQAKQAPTPATQGPATAPTPEQARQAKEAAEHAAWAKMGADLWERRKKGQTALEAAKEQAEADRLTTVATMARREASEASRHSHGRFAWLAESRAKHANDQAEGWRQQHRLRVWLGWEPKAIREAAAYAEESRQSAERRRKREAEAGVQVEADRKAVEESMDVHTKAQGRVKACAQALGEIDRQLGYHATQEPAEVRKRQREAEARAARAAVERQQAAEADRLWQLEWQQQQAAEAAKHTRTGRYANLPTPTPPWVPKPRGMGR